MLLGTILPRFARRTPVSVMVRGTLEYALAPDALDALFRTTAENQYEKQLLFSSVVDLMGLVVARVQPSLNAAYQAVSDTLPVTLTSIYNKRSSKPATAGSLTATSVPRPCSTASPREAPSLPSATTPSCESSPRGRSADAGAPRQARSSSTRLPSKTRTAC